MKYGMSNKMKILLALMTVALLFGAGTGMWKIGMGLSLIFMSLIFHSIHKQQKYLNK